MEELSFDNALELKGKGDPLCVHYPPDMFFADLDDEARINSAYLINEAKKICYKCPYQLECLTFAVQEGVVGIWGGTSQRQRTLMRQNGKVFIPEIKKRAGLR